MPDPLVVSIPDGILVLLIGSPAVAIIHINHGVAGMAKDGNVDPRDQRPGATRVFFTLIRQNGNAITRGELDVIAAGLGVILQAGVGGQIYQNREVGLVRAGNIAVVDGDSLTVWPCSAAVADVHAGVSRPMTSGGGGVHAVQCLRAGSVGGGQV